MRTVAIGVPTEPETEVTWSHMGTTTARNPPQTPLRCTDIPARAQTDAVQRAPMLNDVGMGKGSDSEMVQANNPG
jgi:hypothetical protein